MRVRILPLVIGVVTLGVLCFTTAVGAVHPALTAGPAPSGLPAPLELATGKPAGGESPSGGIEYLISDSQQDIAARAFSTRLAFRVRDAAALTRAAEISIGFEPSYEQIVVHHIRVMRDGEVQERLRLEDFEILRQERDRDRAMYDGRLTAVVQLSDVRVGDVIDYAYTRTGWNPVFGDLFFDSLSLGWSDGIQHFRLRFVTPSTRPLQVRAHGPVSDAETHHRRAGPSEIWEWHAHPLKAIRADNDTPSWFSSYPWLQVSEFSQWSDVVAWALPMYSPAVPLPETIVELQQSLGLTDPAKSADERVLAALEFVQRDVRYLGIEMGARSHRPNPPEVTLRNRFGDCKDKTLLLCALLQGTGIEARPALVNTARGEKLDDWLPSPLAFDHVIVRASVPGHGTVWIDPTILFQEGDLEQRSAPNYGRALVIEPGVTELDSMSRPPPARPRIREDVEITTKHFDEPAFMRVTTLYLGSRATSMRSYLADQTSETLTQTYHSYYLKTYPGLAVEQPVSWTDDKSANRVTTIEHYRITDFWTRLEDGRRQASVSAETISSLVRAPEDQARKSPLALAHPVEVETRIKLSMPSDWEVLASKMEIRDRAFVYESETEGQGNEVRLRYSYRTRADHVEPGDVPGYVAKLAKVRDDIGYVFTYTPPTGPAPFRLNYHTVASMAVTAAAGLVVAYRVLRRQGRAPASIPESPGLPPPLPRSRPGIGGWLWLPAIGLITNPFVLIGAFSTGATGYFDASVWTALVSPESTAYSPALAGLILVEAAANTWLLCHGLLVLILFFSGRRETRPWIVALLLLQVIVIVGDQLAHQAVTSETLQPEDFGEIVRSLVGAAIWIPYFLVSKRVKKTFVR